MVVCCFGGTVDNAASDIKDFTLVFPVKPDNGPAFDRDARRGREKQWEGGLDAASLISKQQLA